MALKIRLRQQGRNNRPFYRLVVTDVRRKRDGEYLEALGWYNPFEPKEEQNRHFDVARVEHWLSLGAQMSENVKTLMKKVAPQVVRSCTEREVARRAKALAKVKKRKAVA